MKIRQISRSISGYLGPPSSTQPIFVAIGKAMNVNLSQNNYFLGKKVSEKEDYFLGDHFLNRSNDTRGIILSKILRKTYTYDGTVIAYYLTP